MYSSLQDFLIALEQAGELHRVQAPVSPLLEISAIADRVSKSPCPARSADAARSDPDHADLGGHALLFGDVEGCDFPLAINVYGSYRRMEMALGCHGKGGFEAIGQRIGSLLKPEPPRSLGEGLAKLREFAPLLRIGPKRTRRAPCQQVVKLVERGEVDLTRLPLLKCWPLDGDPTAVGYNLTPEQAGTAAGKGRYITFAGMHTIHADDRSERRPRSRNIGMYRAQLLDATHLAMHWHIHHDGAAHWRSWKRAGLPMPIAICFGGEAVLPYAATAPLPPGISELLMAGFLNGRGIRLARCATVPLDVPANSEIVIEGFVSTDCGDIGYDPRDGEPLGPGAVFEGPFGDHTGFYSLPDRYPIVNVTAVTHRREAVLPATIVGPPPQEDYYLGKATERIFLPMLRTLIPDIEDYDLPMFGCFHNCVFVKIRKAYSLQARRVMCSIWGAGQMAWTKFIIVVDDDVEVHDMEAVWRAVFANCHFGRDIEMVHGPLDILDHAAPSLGVGCKLGLDATRKVPGEEVNQVPIDPPFPARLAAGADFADGLLGKHGISAVALPDFAGGRAVFVALDAASAADSYAALEFVLDAAAETRLDFAIAVDSSVDVHDAEDVFFHLCAGADPGRDMVRVGDKIGFNATLKSPEQSVAGRIIRDYPPIAAMDEATLAKVDSRWAEYGL